MRVHIVTAVCALAVLALMFELLRRRQLREKYALLWLAFGLGSAALAFFPGVLNWAARLLGVKDPVNLLLFGAALVLLLVCVHLSWEVSRLEGETRTLAEETALLRFRVDKLEEPGGEPDDLSAEAAEAAEGVAARGRPRHLSARGR
jgi:hypothetical protein